jgi:hypothetical protein
MSTDSSTDSTSPVRHKPAPASAVRQHDTGQQAPAQTRQRMIPKPLQRVLGFFVLLFSVGFVSCQALIP